MAVAASFENSFIVAMQASNVYIGFFMSIPSEWAKVYLLNRSHDIELRVKDNAWKAKYDYKGYGGGLTGGWKDFILENFLENLMCVYLIWWPEKPQGELVRGRQSLCGTR
ncbi:hypothetical protein Salat_1208200 [Sesamum alatum]|uniref:TF-B3 domain-containing protein n=1 Tax=Sesamum alatum TaxID=300844 RepID=A0AAE1YFG1_9LAMI|nr:hypothetical protein Salat_1208200 [Sesamum alatum]